MTPATASLQHSHAKTYAFGEFVLDLSRVRLMRGSDEVKLRPKSFELLGYFVENQGRVVTKDELIRAVWPDSFVTDDSLVQCVRDIRRALGDGDAQHYVKTVPKRGYIFELQTGGDQPAIAADAVKAPETPSNGTAKEEARPLQVTAPPLEALAIPQGRFWPRFVVALSVIFAAVVLITWYRWAKTPMQPQWQAVPLTSYRGIETNPSLSPDGRAVAFTWNGEAQNNFDIYVQSIGSNSPLRLTSDPAEESSPEWSPDARTIAFLRRSSGDRAKVMLIPANGGSEYVLTEIPNVIVGGTPNSSRRKNLAWTPDGNWLAVQQTEVDEPRGALVLISRLTGERRTLTRPPTGYVDEHPSFSPDGRTLVFGRSSGIAGSDLYLQALTQDFTPAGEVRRLTTNELALNPGWTSDGSRIVYSSQMANGRVRTIAPFSSGPSEPLQMEGDNIGDLSIGRHLIYAKQVSDVNVWRAEILSASGSPAVPQLLISSTRGDTSARYSPDGQKIAFLSTRSGGEQVWICNTDGSNAVQLTSFHGPVKFPNWSPNSKQIVFHARPDGHSGADLFTISVSGGSAKRLTTDAAGDVLASYSRDGRWIYFASVRSGRSEIWKMPATGGEAIRLTSTGGMMAFESPDGKMLYYSDIVPDNGIWRVPVNGGVSVQVTGPIAKDNAFAVSEEGIYYVTAPESSRRQFIQFLNFSTGQSRPVVVTDHEIGLGLSLSPDGRFLIFPQRDQAESDLMLIENFSIAR